VFDCFNVFILSLNTSGWLTLSLRDWTVGHQPITTEVRVRYRSSPCGICGGESGTRAGYYPWFSVFTYYYYYYYSTTVPHS